ncbi:hypothetical protein KCMC57_up63240 [Kitasatospora sp. CMC57]|uniref:Uncharacterized protein n=1 Tax=Kitasatospora sp. CMC57 TaxID=3231513 RepID=A0AB33KBR9_9ACTN
MQAGRANHIGPHHLGAVLGVDLDERELLTDGQRDTQHVDQVQTVEDGVAAGPGGELVLDPAQPGWLSRVGDWRGG